MKHLVSSKAFLAALLCSAAPFGAMAQYTQFFGDLTCAGYVEAVNATGVNHPYNLYISGYLTGANAVRARITPNDAAGYRVWIKSYCEKNPFVPFADALFNLDLSLGEGNRKVDGAKKKSG